MQGWCVCGVNVDFQLDGVMSGGDGASWDHDCVRRSWVIVV